MDSSKKQLKQGELNLSRNGIVKQQYGKQIKLIPPGKQDFYAMLGEHKIIPHSEDEGVDVGIRPVTKAGGPRNESEIIWYNHSDTPKERGIDKAKRQIEHILESTDTEAIELIKLIAYINSTRVELNEFVKKRNLTDYNTEIVQQTVMSLKDELKLNRTFFKAKAKRMLDEILSLIDDMPDKDKEERATWLEKIPSCLALVTPVLNERIQELPEIAKYNLKKLELLEELDFREKKRDKRLADILVWCSGRMESMRGDSKQKDALVELKKTRSLKDLERIHLCGGMPRTVRGYVWQAMTGIAHKDMKYFENMMDRAIGFFGVGDKLSSGKTIDQLMSKFASELSHDRGPRRKNAAKMLHEAVGCYQSERKKSASIAKQAAEMLMEGFRQE